jgi:hypothetical protein
MILYGISGLGADKRVFQFLKLDNELIPIDWIEPLTNESIEQYTIRFSESIDTSEKFGLIGVSFGGLIATELNKIIQPEITFLISSAETKSELRKTYQLVGKFKLINYLPLFVFNTPKKFAKWIFGAKNEKLLYEIIDDTDLKFVKWALSKLTTWNNKTVIKNCIKIHGSNDKLIPSPTDNKIKLIEGGEHFMIVDRAEEISDIIKKEITNLNNPQP